MNAQFDGPDSGAPPPDGPPRAPSWPVLLAAIVAIAAVAAVAIIIVTRSGRTATDQQARPEAPAITSAAPAATTSSAAATVSGAAGATTSGESGPESSITPEQLQGFLLDRDTLVESMKIGPDPNPALDTLKVVPGTPQLLDISTDRPDCGGVMAIPTQQGLAGSGYTGLQTQVLQPDDPAVVDIVQYAVLFPDNRSAARFLTGEQERWNACHSKHFTVTDGGVPSTWTAYTIVMASNDLGDELMGTTSLTDWTRTCSQTAIFRASVVVGSRICGKEITVGLLTELMAKRIPR